MLPYSNDNHIQLQDSKNPMVVDLLLRKCILYDMKLNKINCKLMIPFFCRSLSSLPIDKVRVMWSQTKRRQDSVWPNLSLDN